MLTFSRSLAEAWLERERADPSSFSALTHLPRHTDGGDLLSILHDSDFIELFQRLAPPDVYEDPGDWICTFRSSSGGTVYSPHEIAGLENPKFLLFMDDLRRRCVLDLELQLRAASIRQEIPREGVCLVFPDSLGVCYLVEYHMSAEQVHVSFLDRLSSPKALLGIEAVASLERPRSKNIAKSYYQSGHKTIVHGGVLTHVDRRLHPHVFGPTIDTLLLASILGNFIREASPASVIEVGVGSGHIYGTAAVYAKGPLDLYGVDIEPGAVSCTDTNLRRHKEVFRLPDVNNRLIIGGFDPDLLAAKFDLLVSNPPYITLEEGEILDGRLKNATASTDLLKLLISNLPHLLSEEGQALFMMSSTTTDVEEVLPEGFEFAPCLSCESVEVPFDVDFALDNPALMRRLVETEAIWPDNNGYAHKLRPTWVRRR